MSVSKAKTSFDKPMVVVTDEEAKAREKSKSTTKKPWRFKSDNVRDVAYALQSKIYLGCSGGEAPYQHRALPCRIIPTKASQPLLKKNPTKAVKNAVEIYSAIHVRLSIPSSYFSKHIEHWYGVSHDKL